MAASQTDELVIGDIYADALLAAANEQGAADEVAEHFDELVAYLDRDPAFVRFLAAMTIDDDARRNSLEQLFRGRMHELLLNLLQVLNDNGRLALVRAVYQCFRPRLREQRGQVEVHVRTAAAMPEDLRRALTALLSEKLGRQAILNEQVDDALIGGLVVQVGDKRVDASMAGQLRRLRDTLLSRPSLAADRKRYLSE
jgi:F-type H+-transporting ATPase subunit delta